MQPRTHNFDELEIACLEAQLKMTLAEEEVAEMRRLCRIQARAQAAKALLALRAILRLQMPPGRN